MKIKIYYEDTDSNAICYHTAYFRFCERDRSEAFFAKGITPTQENSFFVVKNINAEFIGSAKLGDEIEVITCVKKFKKASVILLQQVLLEGIVIFKMDVTIAYVKEKKVSRIPLEYLSIFDTFIS
jgi:acyl-CoA thioester hydrolase